MSRKSPNIQTIRALFAKSGNRCAFPGCHHPLISDSNNFISQICHIEAAEPKGQRYNPGQTDEERRSYDNLILLCYPHHIETNNVQLYTVDELKRIKYQHEGQFDMNPYKIDETALYKIMIEMDEYWLSIDKANRIDHVCKEFGIVINVNSSFIELINEIKQIIGTIESLVNALHDSEMDLLSDFRLLLKRKNISYSIFEDINNNPFDSRNWDTHNIFLPNLFIRLKAITLQAELRYLEEYLKLNANDKEIRIYFEKLKNDFKYIAQNDVYNE